MDLQFRAADLEFQAEVRAFIDRHWPAHVRRPRGVASHYVSDRRPEEEAWFAALIERGWSVPDWPLEHGGTGWSPTQKFIWERETARAETPKMSIFGTTMLAPILFVWGNQAQQAEFLPPIREARVQWCQGYSEPGAGSDLAALGTRAVRAGDHYVVNGVKTWTSGAHIADWMFCLVRTDATAARPQEGISFLLIDMLSPGVQVRPILTLGSHHSVNEVTLADVRVPVTRRLGEENAGWTVAKALLQHERTSVARVGMSRVQLERVKSIAGETGQDGATLLDDPAFQKKLSALEVELLGLEMLELRSLADAEKGHRATATASILKLRGTEVGQKIAELAVETFGYYAIAYPDALLIDNEGEVGHEFALPAVEGMLFSRSWSIYGGASEVQKNIIAKSELGL